MSRLPMTDASFDCFLRGCDCVESNGDGTLVKYTRLNLRRMNGTHMEVSVGCVDVRSYIHTHTTYLCTSGEYLMSLAKAMHRFWCKLAVSTANGKHLVTMRSRISLNRSPIASVYSGSVIRAARKSRISSISRFALASAYFSKHTNSNSTCAPCDSSE